MDLGVTIIGAILIAICIVPIILMGRNRKKTEKKAFQSLINIANQQSCIINKHEICGDFVLGIDENRNFVFFFKQKKEEAISKFVDLSEVHICQAVKKTRNVKIDKENHSIIERVDLSFILTNKNKGEVKFELYDEEINTQLSGELQFVEKWAKQINDRLKNKK